MGDNARTELVRIKHPDHPERQADGAAAVCTREAFDTIYEDAGYVIIDEEARAELKAMKKAELEAEAERRGVDLPEGNVTKAQLIELLEGTEG